MLLDSLDYSDKLAHVQVVINCLILLHQSAHKDMLAQVAPGFLDDVMSYKSLTTLLIYFTCEIRLNRLCSI